MRCGPAARRFALGSGLAAALAAAAVAAAITPLVVGPFAQATPGGPLPAGWAPLEFSGIERRTEYSLMRDGDGTVVVRAFADRSASGLIRKVDLSAAERPLLAWRWKAERLLVRGDVHRKDGDDYPARIYVSFRYSPERLSFAQRIRWGTYRVFYGEYPPHAALNYIWDANAPAGTTVPNPFTDRVRMIVVESGPARLAQWVAYERDIAADYRLAFGEEPPPISGIALMTDADNTGETVTAYYGDITLSPRR